MQHRPYGFYERFIKRPLDSLLAACALLLTLPLLGVLALLVRVKLGAPALFLQERVGRNERVFRMVKFRTMTDARDENGVLLPDDRRLTPFGKRLRSSSLDELPELFNILRGDMALVGPRPLHRKYLPYYTETERMRHTVRPGLSGLAQVCGRNALDWGERLKLDVTYTRRITFLADAKILLLTVKTVWKRDGAQPETGATTEDFRDYCARQNRTPQTNETGGTDG